MEFVAVPVHFKGVLLFQPEFQDAEVQKLCKLHKMLEINKYYKEIWLFVG